MEIPVAERALLDTNVLLAATDEGRSEHGAAVEVLTTWPASSVVLYTSGQILRSTSWWRPGRCGLQRPGAAEPSPLLSEGADVADRLLSLLEEVGSAGKQIHDASVVATMLVRGVGAMLTLNVRDFASFAGHVSVVPLCPP